MNRVVWFTCALIALVSAHVYERCELARELSALGVHPDNIATWVCIAYHESRFDTAARNLGSGDHGLFQISELYWCGPGKACGITCSALRDEDISNDLECALQVHEEHTRLQGDGFMAWVVYPQHCKHNTKKYLVDCDTSLKSRPIFKPRAFTYNDDIYSNNITTNNKQKVGDSLPPYLASIGFIFRGSYGKVLGASQGNIDWINYKVDNIDDLKLPVFGVASQPVSTSRSATTATTTTTYVPPVKPWRAIETNQFRRKHPENKATLKTEYLSSFKISSMSTESVAELLQTTKTKQKVSEATTALRNRVTAISPAVITTTSLRPLKTSRPLSFSSTTYRAPTTATAQRPFSTNTFSPLIVTITPPSSITTKSPWLTNTVRTLPTSTTYKPFTMLLKLSTTTRKPHSWYTFTTKIPNTTPVIKKFTQTFAQTPRPYTISARTPETTSISAMITQKSKPTQSIFDLYLNPTKPPKLPTFKFLSDSDTIFKLKIFSDGITTAAPQHRSPKSPTVYQFNSRGAGKNYTRDGAASHNTRKL